MGPAENPSAEDVRLKVRRLMARYILPLGPRLLRSTWIPGSARLELWSLIDKYVSFLDVRRDAKTAFGSKMRVSSAPRVEQEILYFGEWEPLFTRYLLDLPQSDGVFIDCGANIGYFTLLASTRFAEVHAIEASPSIAKQLRDNLALNRTSNIEVHEVAIGRESGVVDFYKNEGATGCSSIYPAEGRALEARVPMRPLSDILRDVDLSRIEFIKLDLEGAEAIALEQIADLSDRLAPELQVVVEYNPSHRPVPGEASVWTCIERLLSLGFSAHVLQRAYDRFEYLDDRRSGLEEVDRAPDFFCDLLLRRCSGMGEVTMDSTESRNR